MADTTAYLSIVQSATPTAAWSQGVKLARSGRVACEKREPDEVVLRVPAPGHAIAPTVVLYLDDEEWACDCGSPLDPCAHVAAAAIALKQGLESAAAEAAPSASLSYRITRPRPGALLIERYVSRPPKQPVKLESSLASAIARQSLDGLNPTHGDLAVDRILTAHHLRTIPAKSMPLLLEGLVDCENIELDGRKVQASSEVLKPIAIVEDAGEKVALQLKKDPRITEVIAPGLVLAGSTLHALAHMEQTGMKLERLPFTRQFAQRELGELRAQITELGMRFPVEIRSKRLPELGSREKPRIHFEIESGEHASLDVLPLLVYGEPPRARVEAGRLVHLKGDVPKRDLEAERTLEDRLRNELNLVPGRRVRYHGAEAATLASRLQHFEHRQGSPQWQGTLTPIVDIDGDQIDIRFVLDSEDTSTKEADPAGVFAAWRNGLALAPLSGGGWAQLPQDFLEKQGRLLSELLASRDADKRVPALASPLLAELCEATGAPPPPTFQRLRPLFENFNQLPEAQLPAELTASLRPYQQVGVNWLSFLRDAKLGGILADDMGLGKTLQALSAVRGPSLVVAPRSVLFNWAAEIERFLPGRSVNIYHGPQRQLDGSDFTLTTYNVMRIDIESLSQTHFDNLILDEAQAIKNSSSQAARAARQLSGTFRLALSGTPVENRLQELHSIFQFAVPSLLGDAKSFERLFSEPIARGDTTAQQRLSRRIAPFIMRRLKRNVAPELPEKTENVLYVDLEPHERELYDTIYAASRSQVLQLLREGGSVLNALEALLRLRQAACHPRLVTKSGPESSSKLERLLASLEDATADGHKSLVFSQWTSLLDLIEPTLRERDIAFTRLDGATRDRRSVVEQFQSSGGPPVLLASLKAGGTGLNLTAADHVFLVDPWFNPATEDQAADRAHRIGQERPVFVYRMVAKNTVEERIFALQQSKRALADAALGGAGHAGAIRREDLLALFE